MAPDSVGGRDPRPRNGRRHASVELVADQTTPEDGPNVNAHRAHRARAIPGAGSVARQSRGGADTTDVRRVRSVGPKIVRHVRRHWAEDDGYRCRSAGPRGVPAEHRTPDGADTRAPNRESTAESADCDRLARRPYGDVDRRSNGPLGRRGRRDAGGVALRNPESRESRIWPVGPFESLAGRGVCRRSLDQCAARRRREGSARRSRRGPPHGGPVGDQRPGRSHRPGASPTNLEGRLALRPPGGQRRTFGEGWDWKVAPCNATKACRRAPRGRLRTNRERGGAVAVVVRNTPRTDTNLVDGLGELGVAIIHEAQGRTELLGPHLRPLSGPVRICGIALTCEVPLATTGRSTSQSSRLGRATSST